MRPADLTPVEMAESLARMYEADHSGQDDAPSPQQRTELADYLGCHEEARASAWEAWSAELNPADWDTAEDWLDVEFTQPCPEGRAI